MTEPLIALFESTWGDIDDLCSGLSEDQWNLSTDCPGWSVKDHVAHMIGTENMLRGVQPPADVVVGDTPHVRNDIGGFNEQWVAVYRDKPGAVALDDFRAVTKERLDALRTLPNEKWDEEGFTPEGRAPYRVFMEIRVFDCWYHDQDMREALDQPGFLTGPAADLSVERVFAKGLPYIVGKKAGAPAGSSVVFEVDNDRAAIGVPPEGRASRLSEIPESPTTRLSFDRRSFTRLAGGRWTGDQARAYGYPDIEGDVELGDRVVDNMGFTI